MKRAGTLCLFLLLTVLITTGCWNLSEPDQLVYVSGSGLDLTKDGQIEVSAQIPIPSGIGGGQDGGGGNKKKSFRMMNATGKNIFDSKQNLQTKISRTLFLGHREVILIGQRMAEHGVGNFLDWTIDNPQSETRSRLYVVKDGQAKDVLSMDAYFETLITTGLLAHESVLGLRNYYYRDFLTDVLDDGIQPLVPAIRAKNTKYIYHGSAIFNEDKGLKLVGFLNMQESSYANWITGRQRGFGITSFISKGKGNISVKLQSLERKIQPKIVGNSIHIDIKLIGKGTSVENNTDLDLTNLKDLQIIQDELSRMTQKSIQQLIEKLQKQYHTDIFGFGKSIHHKYPHQWKTLKQNWNEAFSQLQVSVKLDIRLVNIGQTTSSIKVKGGL